MSALAFSGLLNFISCITLAVFVLSRNPANKLHRSYFLFNLAIAIYSCGYFFWQTSNEVTNALYWFKILVFGIILINLTYLHFVFTFLDIGKNKAKILGFVAIASVIFIFLNFNAKLYTGLEPRFDLGFWPRPTFFFHLYLLFWHWTCFYGFYWLLKSLKSETGIRKQQIRFVAIACGIGYIGGATNWPMWYGIHLTPYPNIAISIYIAMIGYSIVRFRLMDLNLIIRWSIAYGAAFLAIFLIYLVGFFAIENILSDYFNIGIGLPILLGIGCAVVIFEPTRRKVSKLVDRFIFKSPDFEIILNGIEKDLNLLDSIEQAASRLINHLKKIWNLEHAGIALWSNSTSNYQLFPAVEFRKEIITQLDEFITQTDYLVKTLEWERRLFRYGIVVDEELIDLTNRASPGEKTTFAKIRRSMRWLGAAACVPLMLNDHLVGFLILGNKHENRIYSEEDKKFLSHVSQIVSSSISDLIPNLSAPNNNWSDESRISDSFSSSS
ncbi:hypothetical protein BVX98_00960 [bacterium F11]|nr:hypothetical protein BVX98_00960 [bacterium F11]